MASILALLAFSSVILLLDSAAVVSDSSLSSAETPNFEDMYRIVEIRYKAVADDANTPDDVKRSASRVCNDVERGACMAEDFPFCSIYGGGMSCAY